MNIVNQHILINASWALVSCTHLWISINEEIVLLIPGCNDRIARKADKHVFSVPLTLMMGRRYFFYVELGAYSIGFVNRHSAMGL